MPTLSARKKMAILDAAIALFQSNGFQGTSMDAIAASAQVSKRTVYNHFPSKQALFETIAQSVWQKTNQATAVAYDPQQPVENQLRSLVKKELLLVSDQEFVKLSRVLAAELVRDQGMAQQLLASFNKEQSSLTIWMQQAGAHGALNVEDAVEAGSQFHSLIKAQAFWPQVMFGQDSIAHEAHEQLAEQISKMFLAVYAKKSE